MESNRLKRWKLALCLAVALFPLKPSLAAAAWFKEPKQITKSHSELGLVILKFGVFSRTGRLRVIESPGICAEKRPVVAWVTHRLSKGEVLTQAVGSKLGKALIKHPSFKCIEGIELNVEPIPTPPSWLAGFLSGVRKALPKRVRLSLAVPSVTTAQIKGWKWSVSQADSILKEIDGFDFMLYDTISSSKTHYKKVIEDAISYAKDRPKKWFTFGFPAYQDKTSWHPLEIENLTVVEKILAQLTKSLSQIFCRPRVEIAYYAGWTMLPEDFKQAKQIAGWKEKVCGKK